RDQLRIATSYLISVDDFLGGFRTAFRPPNVLEHLEKLRRLVFHALAEGVNVAPGDRIRCAFLVPEERDGEVRLRIRYHQGHTEVGEEHLALYPDHRSIAG